MDGQEMFGEDEVFQYFDGLRESGVVNMFGAGPYLQEEFGLDKKEARTFLAKWMNTFSKRHREEIWKT